MDEKPKLLYHYTSIEAFKGILEDQCLRMTKYDQMNDSQEVILALEIIKKFLSSYNCAKEYKEFKEFLLKELAQYEKLELYITSFSEKPDDLEQWRAYTQNGGVSIGFEFEVLKKGFIFECLPDGEYDKGNGVVKKGKGFKSVRNPFLFQCKYDSSVTRKAIEQQIGNWFNGKTYAGIYQNLRKGKYDKVKFMNALFYAALGRSIYNLSIEIKNEVYAGEKEWRWMNINPDSERFIKRLDEKNRVYVKTRIHPEDFIKEVRISPHGKTDVIRRVVDFYKEKYKLPYEIHKSEIPYRLT